MGGRPAEGEVVDGGRDAEGVEDLRQRACCPPGGGIPTSDTRAQTPKKHAQTHAAGINCPVVCECGGPVSGSVSGGGVSPQECGAGGRGWKRNPMARRTERRAPVCLNSKHEAMGMGSMPSKHPVAVPSC